MKRKLKKLITIFILLTLLSASFMLGAFSAQMNWLPDIATAKAAQAKAAQAKAVQAKAAQAKTATAKTAEANDKLTVFLEAWNLIQNYFIDQEVLEDTDPLIYAALKGLTEALGDTGHTRFLTPEEAQEHNTAIHGKFFGIGAYLGLNDDNHPVIINPFEDSPAKRAGLRAGDLILAVDGIDVTTWTIDEIVTQVKGEKGTPVTIKVLHKEDTEPVELLIIRDEIIIPAIEWTFLPDSKIAFIRLDQFSTSAKRELEAALTEAQDRGATGVIFDLRYNSGGLLEQAVLVASQFLDEGFVLQQEDTYGHRRTFEVRQGGVALDIPLVVLVNEVSASSAEIVAGAIQDHQRGLIIGTTTFGTGTILTPYTLSDNSVLLLGTGQWLTANGRVIRHKGITPDVVTELPENYLILYPHQVNDLSTEELFHAGDRQLIEGIKRLNNCWTLWGCDH